MYTKWKREYFSANKKAAILIRVLLKEVNCAKLYNFFFAPQIHVSAINEGLDSSTRTSPYSSGGEAGDSEGESLSEGPISEDGSVRENLNYIPKVCMAHKYTTC